MNEFMGLARFATVVLILGLVVTAVLRLWQGHSTDACGCALVAIMLVVVLQLDLIDHRLKEQNAMLREGDE